MTTDLSVVILAAGKGTRMKSARPKVLHPLCGRPMLAWVVELAASLAPQRVVLVVGEEQQDEVERAARAAAGGVPLSSVVQQKTLGTGHAVQVAAEVLGEPRGRVLVLYGDMPLLRRPSLVALVDAQARAGRGGCSLLTGILDDPRGYGRILRDERGAFRAIVEERDASDEEKDVQEVNLGVYCFPARELFACLPKLQRANSQGELYLTDVAGLFVSQGWAVETLELDDQTDAIGINTLAQLAEARWEMQVRILEEHMANGVLIEDPATTYVAHGVKIGAGTHILPCTYVHTGVVIGRDCEVGPFVQLREGTVLEDEAEVGNFTECKKTVLRRGAKAKHLAYLGDTDVGAGANIGAGTIFANYDGRAKHQCKVGEAAFIGSGTIVVAPNEIGARAVTGAGAVVTRGARVGAGEEWIGVPARKLVRTAGTSDREENQTNPSHRGVP